MVAASDVGPMRQFRPKMPNLGATRTIKCLVDYDRQADALVVCFDGCQDRPTVGVVIGDYEMLRVDPLTEEIVGFEVERFLGAARYRADFLTGALGFIDLTPAEHLRVRWNLRDRSLRQRQEPKGEFVAGLIETLRTRLAPAGHAPNPVYP